MDRRNFIKVAATGMAATAVLAPKFAFADRAVSSVTVGTCSGFSILALTDLHFFLKDKADDQGTLDDIARMIEDFSPDFMVLNGDVWHDNPDGRAAEFCPWVCEKMGGFGLPWAFVRGNHDLADDFATCARELAAAKNSLYPGCDSANYRIEVIGKAGGAPIWNILVVNDGVPVMGYTQKEADWIAAEAERIKREHPERPPAFLFNHIPLTAFVDVVANGKAVGIKREGTTHENGLETAFEAVQKTGMVKAVFAGHDHCNDYQGNWRGVRLEYLRSTGRAGYGGWLVKKGATLITAGHDGPQSFQTKTVFPNGRSWIPRQKARLLPGEKNGEWIW